MFWDKVSFIYDFVETVYNKDVYNNTGKMVASYIESTDVVLECACGTGAISKHIATKCNRCQRRLRFDPKRRRKLTVFAGH